MITLKLGTDFAGVGSILQALNKLKERHAFNYREVFACDKDRFARQTYVHNYGEPPYFPNDVYDREIPEDPLDIYMTSPPCQAFSNAGLKKGKLDPRGILFFNSHEFIRKNRPRVAIFENVKGLLSNDEGRTFQEWTNMLGGKSVNGNPVMFPDEEAVPYHIFWRVLNATDFGIPQNRERVFIVCFRDDADAARFTWPKERSLDKTLRDLLEDEVDPKYFLSDAAIATLTKHGNNENNGHKFETERDIAKTILTDVSKNGTDDNYVLINSNTEKGYEVLTEGDSLSYAFPSSETRRGRVGIQVAQTLDTDCKQAVMVPCSNKIKVLNDASYSTHRIYDVDGVSPALTTMTGGNTQPYIQQLPRGKNKGGIHENCPAITCNSWEQNNLLFIGGIGEPKRNNGGKGQSRDYNQGNRVYDSEGIAATLTAQPCGGLGGPTALYMVNPKIQQLPRGKNEGGMHENCPAITTNGWQQNNILHYKNIRRLTPRECFRLMGYPDSFSWPVSDTQAYRQAGNSIVTDVLEAVGEKIVPILIG